MTIMSEHRIGVSRHIRTVFDSGALGSLADGALLERYLAGRGDEDSAAAFAALAERHGPMVLSVCQAAMGDPHDAEDAAQATFLVLARRAGSIRRAESLASWLFGVALKVSSKARAQTARRRALERRGAEMRAQAAGSDRPGETRSEVCEELDRLPERFRSPIVLCHLEGLTNEQAASRLGLPVRTVQRRLAAGRERLRHRLTGRGLAPVAGADLGLLGPVAGRASEAWIEATARAAAGLAAGRAVGAVASAPVASLVKGVMVMMFVGRLKVVAAGLFVSGSLAGLAGVGWLWSAWQEAPPPAAEAQVEGVRPAPPPVAKAGPRIKGLVVDEGRQPVAGARVWSLESSPRQIVITGADGTFDLPDDRPEVLEHPIIASADGGARQGMCLFQPPADPNAPGNRAGMMLHPAHEVTVTVVNGRGAPVPDAAVFLLDVVYPAAEARTDGRGIAVLRVPTGVRTAYIVAVKPGVGFDYFENYQTDTPTAFAPPPREARLVLGGVLRNVRVRVVDSAGRPVPGIEMYPVTIQKMGKYRFVNLAPLPLDPHTDADGVATFDWLPADLSSASVLPATPVYTLPRPCEVDPSKPDALLTARVRRMTRVSGKVTFHDGSPAPWIRVEARGSGGRPGTPEGWEAQGRATTAADGSYEMQLMPGVSYTIKVADHEGVGPGLSSVEVREGVPRTGLDLSLVRGPADQGAAPPPPSAGQAPAPAPPSAGSKP